MRLSLLLSFALVLPAMTATAGCERLAAIAKGQIADAHGTAAIAAEASAWRRHGANPVIAVGETTPVGALAQAATDPSVTFDEKTRKWKMWYTVAYRDHGQERRAIRYAESVDGYDWRGFPGFAFSPAADAGAWDGQRVERATVLENPQAHREERYMLFYAGAATAKGPTSIGCAVSPDGRTFTRLPWSESRLHKAGLVMVAQDAFPGRAKVTGSLTDPAVEIYNDRVHLWFTSRATSNGRPLNGICHARSTDGTKWVAATQNPLASLARKSNPGGPANPAVAVRPDARRLEMWYTDDRAAETQGVGGGKPEMTLGYWHATSTDGDHWTTEYAQGRDFRWDRAAACEAGGPAAGPAVVAKGGQLRLYYPARGTHKVPAGWPTAVGWGINVATRHED